MLSGPLIPLQNQLPPPLGGPVSVPSLSPWREETIPPQVSDEDDRSLPRQLQNCRPFPLLSALIRWADAD